VRLNSVSLRNSIRFAKRCFRFVTKSATVAARIAVQEAALPNWTQIPDDPEEFFVDKLLSFISLDSGPASLPCSWKRSMLAEIQVSSLCRLYTLGREG
jgi:hypothetical protein